MFDCMSTVQSNTQAIKHSNIQTITNMDLNFKIKIDQLIGEVSALTDLTTKIAVLNYIQQESGFLLWQLEDEQRIDEDSRDY